MSSNIFASNSTTTNIAFIRVDFNVGEITPEESQAIAKDVDACMFDTNLTTYPGTMYDGGDWRFGTPNFSVFYNENDNTEKLKKLFFKLKLRHPEFKILSQPTSLSFYE